MARRLAGVRAVLFDRDDTLVRDSPRYNGDPTLVRPIPGAAEAVSRVRAMGLPVGVTSNQSGIGLGLFTHDQARLVNAEVDALVGPFDTWHYCPHAPGEGCRCRKPAPGLVLDAAEALGVPPRQVAMIGHIWSDVEAARRAGSVGILVPSERTRRSEARSVPLVAGSLGEAVDLIQRCARGRTGPDREVAGATGSAGSGWSR
jgi:histidinol-phosphate phosphatase family protein